MSATIATAAPEPAALTIAAGGMSAMRTAADAGDDAALAALERAAAWTPNTRRAYGRAWAAWSAWAAAHDAPPLPAMARDVRRYILERADAGRSMGTLRADAAGIAAVHRAAGQAGPCEPRGVVSATLARLAKSEPHARRAAPGPRPHGRSVSRHPGDGLPAAPIRAAA